MAKKKKIGARIYPAHKPKEGVTHVLWWNNDDQSWQKIWARDLDPGDIWVSYPKMPSDRLINRAWENYSGD